MAPLGASARLNLPESTHPNHISSRSYQWDTALLDLTTIEVSLINATTSATSTVQKGSEVPFPCAAWKQNDPDELGGNVLNTMWLRIRQIRDFCRCIRYKGLVAMHLNLYFHYVCKPIKRAIIH
jgi:hypothetical protein